MELIQNCFFRDELRSARGVALADAEGFQSVIRVVELMGQVFMGKIGDLGKYTRQLSDLANTSPLAVDVPLLWQGYHTEFGVLYEEVRQARNDAVHQGAYARTLTRHAVELSIILEDALMTDASKVSQFMVRNVVEAKLWHPVSHVRQQMLTYAFSYLPIWHDEVWKLIPEYAVARLLRNARDARGRLLAARVDKAIVENGLELLTASVVGPETPIAGALLLIGERPLLVVDRTRPETLVGVLTSSDVL